MVHVCVWPTKGQLAVNKQGKWSIKALVLVVVFVWLLLLRFNLHTQHIHTQHTHTLRETQMCSTLCGARISLPQRRRRRRLRSIELKCAKKKARKEYHRKAETHWERQAGTCRCFRTSKRPLLLLPLHSLHLFTCWLCVYRKLAARIFPLELSASPSLALPLIGHRRRRCLIASDSFKESAKGLPILFTHSNALSLSLSLSLLSHLVCVCLANWPLHKYLPAHMFRASWRKLCQQQNITGMEWNSGWEGWTLSNSISVTVPILLDFWLHLPAENNLISNFGHRVTPTHKTLTYVVFFSSIFGAFSAHFVPIDVIKEANQHRKSIDNVDDELVWWTGRNCTDASISHGTITCLISRTWAHICIVTTLTARIFAYHLP